MESGWPEALVPDEDDPADELSAPDYAYPEQLVRFPESVQRAGRPGCGSPHTWRGATTRSWMASQP